MDNEPFQKLRVDFSKSYSTTVSKLVETLKPRSVGIDNIVVAAFKLLTEILRSNIDKVNWPFLFGLNALLTALAETNSSCVSISRALSFAFASSLRKKLFNRVELGCDVLTRCFFASHCSRLSNFWPVIM